MEKIYHKNSITDLVEFRKESITDWNESNNASAEEWDKVAPKTKEEFEKYYQDSEHYIESMATYNATSKKLRLIDKIFKIIVDLDVETIVDFGCGVGSDSMWLAKFKYKVIGMDLPSIAFDFFKWRLNKHNIVGVEALAIEEGVEIPKADLILSLDTLEHVHNPYETIDYMVKEKPKYLLLTTAFGVHETAHHKIPMHTDHKVSKVEAYIESKGYEKQKLHMAFPPRLFIRKD